MLAKIFFSLFFLLLNTTIWLLELKTLRLNIWVVILYMVGIISIWIINAKFDVVPIFVIKEILFFSFALFLIEELSNSSYLNADSLLGEFKKSKLQINIFTYFKRVKFTLIFVLLPILVTGGQLKLIWDR